MVTLKQGEIWWANLDDSVGSEPGFVRPVLVVQDDIYNHSQLETVIVVSITSNQTLANMPGNVFLPKKQSKLNKDSVVNVTQLTTIDKDHSVKKISDISTVLFSKVQDGLRLVLNI